MIDFKNQFFYLDFFKNLIHKNFLIEINYSLITLLIPLTIWARELPISILGLNKSLYSFFLISIDFLWLILNLYFFIKERKLLLKINNLIFFSLIYSGIFLLDYSTNLFDDPNTEINFLFLKFIAFVLISTNISEININLFKKILFRSGNLSFIIYFFIYIRQVFLTKGEVFSSYNGRLNFGIFNPNTLAYGLLITLLLLTLSNSTNYKLLTKLIFIVINSFIIINIIQTQSRTTFIILFINLSLLIFYKFKENLELFASVPISFIYLSFLDNINKLKSLSLFAKRISNLYIDNGGGRLDIWVNCYDSLPTRLVAKILKKRPENINLDFNCEGYSSHNVLIDIFTTGSPLFLKIYFFISIYLLYGFFILISIYKQNILSLNLALATTFYSFFNNSMRDPITLLLIPIIFNLIKEPKTKKS